MINYVVLHTGESLKFTSIDDNNRAFESQMRVYQHIQDEVTEKNNEIVRLERRVKDIENVFFNTISTIILISF